ncbi:glycosyltransferase [Gillisia sp. Hel_I_29]|uniref:glycosyltransferase n=1 Tax=Gillisia sp. Hel_I_29 TaxID=1249975 RepID=UPI000555DFB6|nr:glycosyltransferase [Gillisia sp. Hel_I_29]
MKVLYIIDTLSGYGAEKSILQIAQNLNCATPVFIQLFEGNGIGNLHDKKSIKIYSLKLENDASNGLEKIINIVRLENPQIIHSTLFRADQFARKLKRLFPSIIFVGSFVSNSYNANRFKQLSFISKLKLRSTQFRDRISAVNVDYFISNSEAIKKSNVKALGIPSNKVTVIYRGRSFEEKKTSDRLISKTRRELNIAIDKTVFLNVARLSIGKGQLDLVKAFKKFSDNNSNVILLLIGEGVLLKELQNCIERLELKDKVFLLGYRNDVHLLLQLANYFVFPSYFEGLSGALIEAIMSKTPCIISDIPENMECFPKNAMLSFQPGNIQQMAMRMDKALNMDNWTSITTNAYNFAKKNFDIKIVSTQYDNFYNKIAANIS